MSNDCVHHSDFVETCRDIQKTCNGIFGEISTMKTKQATDSQILSQLKVSNDRVCLIIDGNGGKGLPEQMRILQKEIEGILKTQETTDSERNRRHEDKQKFKRKAVLFFLHYVLPACIAASAGVGGTAAILGD